MSESDSVGTNNSLDFSLLDPDFGLRPAVPQRVPRQRFDSTSSECDSVSKMDQLNVSVCLLVVLCDMLFMF